MGTVDVVVSGRIADVVTASNLAQPQSLRHVIDNGVDVDPIKSGCRRFSRRPMLVDGGVRSVVLGLVMFRDTS